MNLISKGDLIDLYHKIHERGLQFILDKFSFSSAKRRYNTWKNLHASSSNWWDIEAIQKRWNEKITGNPGYEYENYVVEKHLQHQEDLTLLSIGCGTGSHEIKFGLTGAFKTIIGLDIATGPINYAIKTAENLNLKNVEFVESTFENYQSDVKFDIVLFHASLHHFSNIRSVLDKTNSLLAANGRVIIHEYVGPNRFQFSKERMNNINMALSKIPIHYTKRQFSNVYKKKVYVPGLLRMIVADPSEACNSEVIVRKLHEKFECLEEKKMGGDILHLLLKDIAHNFNPETTEATATLKYLFDFEDDYMKSKTYTDFMFGIYRKK
jgi:2-polyprenyl-3-methyl-5-hydroxy-6-metoxy-1,4-benzoquinol methylase